jgi:hypothetical protein
VVKPLLPDLDGFLPQAMSALAPKIGHRYSGVISVSCQPAAGTGHALARRQCETWPVRKSLAG